MRQLWNHRPLLKPATVYRSVSCVGFRLFTECLSHPARRCGNEESGPATSSAIPSYGTSACRPHCERPRVAVTQMVGGGGKGGLCASLHPRVSIKDTVCVVHVLHLYTTRSHVVHLYVTCSHVVTYT